MNIIKLKASFLGVVEVISRAYFYLNECIWKNIRNWSSKSLSRVGKEVSVKSVAQAIPSCYMSVFLLPPYYFWKEI